MGKGIFYGTAIVFVVSTAIVVILEPFLPAWCDENKKDTTIHYQNPSYVYYPCRHMRFSHLLYLTPEECDFGRRLVVSVCLGGVIGWERRMADRPAGIRTMSLVSLASCLFTICSAFAFINGPMSWDASRIAAAIPSGVGFLGAGLIFKEAQKNELTGEQQHVVHGLTTATSVWLSAAVGCACGGGLYFVAVFCTTVMLVLLRFGPRFNENVEDEEEEYDDPSIVSANARPNDATIGERESLVQNDVKSFAKADSNVAKSLRSRAALGSLV